MHIASLLDIAATKAADVQQRGQARDYLDIDALIRHRHRPARRSRRRNRLRAQLQFADHTQGALSYFDDVPTVPEEVRERLRAAVEAVDSARLPISTPHVRRADDGRAP